METTEPQGALATDPSPARREALARTSIALGAIETHKRAMHAAVDLEVAADALEAQALLATYRDPGLKDALRDNAARKAHATLAALEARRAAGKAAADARTAGDMVDLLLGGRAR